MQIDINPMNVEGLTEVEQYYLARLIREYEAHQVPNDIKRKYYEGHVTLADVNLGIALPVGLRKLEVGCSWGAKTVDVLAGRSMFDGFVGENGTENDQLTRIVDANQLLVEYPKAARDELLYGTSFATLSKDPAIGCKIRFHSPCTASAIWDGERGAIRCGMAIIDYTKQDILGEVPTASVVNFYTDADVIVLRRVDNGWAAARYPHGMGLPLMVPMTWAATSTKPFGRSRIKKPIRNLIDGYVRTLADAAIGLEFSTSPQKYILGVTDEQYDAIVGDKFRQYVGSIIAATTNPETGEKPTFGQLQQGTISPHVEMIRILATQFSAATGLTVTDTGVVNDANPTSSDAILAQSQTLVSMAEQLNMSNGQALKMIAMMATAMVNGVGLNELTDAQRDVIAHFKNPAMPSVAVTADAAIKIASARPEFAATDTFLEMIGFDQADIRRIRAQEARARGMAVLRDIEGA